MSQDIDQILQKISISKQAAQDVETLFQKRNAALAECAQIAVPVTSADFKTENPIVGIVMKESWKDWIEREIMRKPWKVSPPPQQQQPIEDWRELLKDAQDKFIKTAQQSAQQTQAQKSKMNVSSKPRQINISLDSPSVSFTIPDLEKDPKGQEREFVEFLKSNLGDDLELSTKGEQPGTFGAPQQQIMCLQTKINWGLAEFKIIEANKLFILEIKVPLF